MTRHRVSDHYDVEDLGGIILAALAAAGKDVDALTVDDLAPVDEFHIRGRAATEELSGWAGVAPGELVLDVGCGLGGTSRFLATTTGCRVLGVDLTEEYCRVAEMLSSRVGLSERTEYRRASALKLPFPDSHFDVVWTEHVQMNIPDKAGFYREIARVCKAGGQFAFHDILGGEHDNLHFPVPWAGDGSISHLIRVDDLRALLASVGFEPRRWEDRTEASIRFFRETLEQLRTQGRPDVGLHLLMGDDAMIKFGNVLRNLEEDRVRVVQAVMKRSSAS